MRAQALFLIVLLHVFIASAAMEFLPPLKTEEDFEKMREKIQRRLPWIQEDNSDEMLQRQINGLEHLKTAFPEYMKWAAEKPDPIVIEVNRVEAGGAQVATIQKERMNLLQRQATELARSWFGSDLVSKDTKQKMRMLVLEKLSQSSLAGVDGIRGPITGLIQVLPGQQRGEIFKLGQAQLQVEALEKLITTDAQLKQSQFRPEVLGLTSEQLTVQSVFGQLKARLNQGQNVIAAMTILQALEKISDAKQEKLSPAELIIKLTETDFRFMEGPKDPSFAKIIGELGSLQKEKETALAKSLEASMAAIPRSWFEMAQQAAVAKRNYLKIIEVHPYLGVYRGCVGGDCSTDYSSMFPYIPWEHIFYIQKPGGTFVGYISATRVQVKDKVGFYIKDLTGETLSAAMAEVVMNALSKVYKHYGADSLLIASASFTAAENHKEKLIEVHAKYNSKVPEVPIRFFDGQMRSYIHRNNQIFESSGGYDSPTRHQNAVPFIPSEGVLKDYEITFHKGTLDPFVPTTPKDSLIHALNMLNVDSRARVTKEKTDMTEVREIFKLLKNPSARKLDSYYEDLTKGFAKFGVELSRAFRNENDALFVRGHISASDAFSHPEESMRNESERHLMNFIRQHRDFILSMELVLRWQKYLNESRRMNEVVELFTQRLNTVDAMNLVGLADAGILSAKKALETERVQATLPAVLAHFVNEVARGHFIAGIHQKNSFAVLSWALKNSSRLTTQEFDERVSSSTQKLGFKNISQTVRDTFLRFRVLCKDGFSEANFPVNFPYFLEKVKRGEMDRIKLSTMLLKKAKWIQNSGALKQYVNDLALSNDHIDVFEIYALASVGVAEALEVLKTQKGKVKTLKFLDDWRSDKLDKDSKLPEFIEKLRAEFDLPLFKFSEVFQRAISPTYTSKIEEVYTKVDELMKPLGWTHRELFQNPHLREKIANNHLEFSGSFRSDETFVIEYSLKFLWDSIATDQLEVSDMNRLMEGFVKGRLKPEQLTQFVKHVESKAVSGKCKTCLYPYVHFILHRQIPEPANVSLEFVHRLLASGYSLVRLYGARLAVIHYPNEVLPRIDFVEIARKLSTTPDQVIKHERPVVDELILNVLVRMNTAGTAEIPTRVYEKVKKLEAMTDQVKLAYAILRNGGDYDLMNKAAPAVFTRKFAESFTAKGLDRTYLDRLLALTSEPAWQAEKARQAALKSTLCRGVFNSPE